MRARPGALPLVALVALALACGEPSAPEAAAPEPVTEEPAPAESAAPAPPRAAPPPAPEPTPAPPPVLATPEPAAPPPPALDLDGLEQRLKQTRALGVFTKLALKNEIDDLIDDVDAFHREGQGRLADLRERFELLVLKLASLLQDDEPELAREIVRAREGLWRLLADPVEFARLSA